MRAAATALAIAMASSGCAVIAAKAPDPNRPISEVPQCNTGKGGVAVDTVAALLLGVTAIAVAKEETGAGVLLGLTGGVYGASAAAGSSSANKCRKALERYDAFIAEERASPGGLGGLVAAPGAVDAPRPAPAVAPAPVAPPPVAVVAPGPATPAPAPTPPPPTRPQPPPKPQPPPADADDPWSAFWQEVPR